MTKHFFGKALAVVLTVALLVSCMVISFGGASAAEEKLMWENDFTASEGTDTNWMKAYTNTADNAWFSNDGGNYATYDSVNSVMALKFTNANSWMYMSGFAMMHKNETHANTGVYGYHGGETTGGTMAKYGAFRPTKGAYKVTLKYKVESFSATEGAKADICVGFALRTQWKWYGSTSQRANFINSTNKGHYEIAATVDASTANTWQTASVTIDQVLDDAAMMHVFARNNDNAGKDLNGTTILVDEIKVYELTPPSTKVMWQNTFDSAKGTDSNWKKAYTNTADNAWFSNTGNNAATYDAANGAMELSFKSAGSYAYMSGFAMFHETATVAGSDIYGCHGGESSSVMINYGAFRPAKDTYSVSLDYKVTEFTDWEDAAIDLCVGFAARTSWKWYGDKSRATFIDGTNKGVYDEIATVTASDKGADWRTVTITIDQPSDEAMLMHVFARSSEGIVTQNNRIDFTGTKILIDNVRVYKTDAALDQTVNDREQYLYCGEANGVATNLHRHTANNEDTNAYTSIRLGATYKSGDENGSTIILNGKEYEIVERGILVGEANRTLNLNKHLWKSTKASNGGFANNWDKVANGDAYDITYTLRLANMSKAWFEKTDSYQYRSYYTVKVPYVDSDNSEKVETFTIYGGVSEAFTFAQLADDFKKDTWFE